MTLSGAVRQAISGVLGGGRRGRARLRRAGRRVRRVVAAALGPVLAVTAAALPAVPPVAIAAGAAGAVAASVAVAAPAKAATPVPVLVLAQNGETTAPEATVLQAAGYAVTQVTPATWAGMSTSQFAGYAALVIGDPSAGGTCSNLTPTTGTSGSDALGTAWQAAVTGNIAVLGTAPALPGTTAANMLISDSAGYAAAGYSQSASTGTGLYVSLNCEYSGAAAGTDVALLDGVEGIGAAGGLKVQGNLACADPGSVNTWEAAKAGTFGGFTSSSLTAASWGTGCPVDEAFGTWPAMFTPVGYDAASDATQDFTASDGTTGQPYVLFGAPVSAATAALAPSAGGEVLGGTTAGGTSNPAAPGVRQGSAGDPVNTENGDFSQSYTDLSLPGFGPALDFTRTYDAATARQQTQSGTPGPMGYGWTDNWATSLAAARPVPGDIYAAAGLRTDNGNGGPAAGSIVANPAGVTVDGSGNVYFADTKDNRIQEIPAAAGYQWGMYMYAGDVYTVAGQADGQFELPLNGGLQDGTPALQMVLNHPEGLAVDSSGDLFIADTNNCRIAEVQPGGSNGAGVSYTYAGQAGACGYSGEGLYKTSTELNHPAGIHFGQGSQSGDLLIADTGSNRIRDVPVSNETAWGVSMQPYNIYTVAGNGQAATTGAGNGTAALAAPLDGPQGVTVYGTQMLIADTGNCRIADVPQSGGTYFGVAMSSNDIYDVAGRYGSGLADCALGNENKAATQSDLNFPAAVRCPDGTLYIADTSNNRVQEVSSSGTATIAVAGFSAPQDLWLDGSGDIYVADPGDSLIQEVTAGGGSPNPVAGGSAWTLADTGNGGAAVNAALNGPAAVASDSHGDEFIADTRNNRVQEIAAWTHTQFGMPMTAGNVYTVAGNATGSGGYGGDGTAETGGQILLSQPAGVAVDTAGNLYIADTGNSIVREMAAAAPYDITTIGGQPDVSGAFAGGGGAATSATLTSPDAVTVDAARDVFFTDTGNNEVLEIYAAGGSSYGQTMSAGDIYVLAGASTVPAVPAAPAGLTVTGTTSSTVSLSWTAPPGPVTGYYVYEKNSFGGYAQVGQTAGTSLTVTGLAAAKAYTFYVQAYNTTGTSPASATVTGTTTAAVPAAPAGLTVTGTTSSSVSLSWTAPPGTVTGYYIYENGSSTALSSGVTLSGTTATISGLTPSTQYSFTVAAYNSGGTGVQSGPVTATTAAAGSGAPAAPTGLTVTGTTSSSVSLSWTAPPGTVTGYYVYENGSSTALSTGVTITGTTATITGLTPSTQYTFTVAGYNSGGTGPQSGSASATTSASGSGAPAAPTGLTVTGTSYSTVSLAWTAPSGTVTGYYIYQAGKSAPLGPVTTGTSATVTSLSPHTTYTFTVAAYNSAGTGPQSSSVQATTACVLTCSGTRTAVTIPLLASGTGDPSGNSGDGGPATAALLNTPSGLAVDSAGNIYISDTGNNQVREIAAGTRTQWGQPMSAGDIYTIAGSTAGTAGSGGDLGPATAALLSSPQQIALGTAGDLYITDSVNNKVREIAAVNGTQWSQSMTAGDIYHIAGDQLTGSTPDGGPAATDQMWQPYGIGTDPTGDLFILQQGQGFVVPQLQEVTATATPSIANAPDQTSSLYPLNTPGGGGGITVTQPGGSQVTFQGTVNGACTAPYVPSGQYCVSKNSPAPPSPTTPPPARSPTPPDPARTPGPTPAASAS